MKTVVMAVLMASVLSGCVTREVVRTAPAPASNNTVSMQACSLIMQKGSETREAGNILLLHRTDGDYFQFESGTLVKVQRTKWDEQSKQTLYFSREGDLGAMAYNCK